VTSGNNHPGAQLELETLLNIILTSCRMPALATIILNSGIMSDIVPLMRIHPDFDHKIVCNACMIIETLLESSSRPVQSQAQRSIRTLDITGTMLSMISTFVASVSGLLDSCCRSSLHKLVFCLAQMLHVISGSEQRSIIRNGVVPILMSIVQNRLWFGPIVFSSVCHLMYSSLNIDPNSLQIMLDNGVIDAYLAAIQERSRVVVLSLHELPQLLNAVCLTDAGRSRVEITDCIKHIFMMCFEPDAVYLNSQMHARSLKQSVNELLRHHRPLVPIVADVFRTSMCSKFHLDPIRCRAQSADQYIGLRNMIHCYFSMLSGASSYVLEHVNANAQLQTNSLTAQFIDALSDFIAILNEVPQFWVSATADVFLKFFNTVLYIPGRLGSTNADCIAAFTAKWSAAINKSPVHSFENFLACAAFRYICMV
jgi:hypothetical protein